MTERPRTEEREHRSEEEQVQQPPTGPDGDREPQETAAPGAPADSPRPGAAQADTSQPAEPAEATDADARVRELTADLQRLQAEYLNYKRRVDRDRDLVLQNAKFSILSALLPVLDDVDRAREHEELTGGFKAVAESLERIVAGEGLVKFGKKGDEFDPRMHEALMHALSPHVVTTTVDKVVQAGYRIGDRVVRPALVTVVDPDPDAEPSAAGEATSGGQDEDRQQAGAGHAPEPELRPELDEDR